MLLRKIDSFLNGLTMYRLLICGLTLLAGLSLLLSLLGTLTLPFVGLAVSLVLLIGSCYAVNTIMARIWRIPANNESWYITALILFFILPQATTLLRGVSIFLAGSVAMLSKYIVAYSGKHIFNPAAFAAVTLGFAGLLNATWWVGNSLLWPFTLLLGLLIARKIRRFPLVMSFAVVSIAATVVLTLTQQAALGEALKLALITSPLIFLGTIMLTEPSTMPPLRNQQIIFGALVGFLYVTHFTLLGIFIYPELALLVGNIYAFAVSPRYRLRLRLQEIQKISDRVYNYVFIPDRPLAFAPGQYMEWTMDTNANANTKSDSRGNRRTFSVASSPTEKNVQLGVKFYEPSSSFKTSLKAMKPGGYLYAGQLSGNFTLPADTSKKLVLIAGGVGITPFRSMLKHLVDTDERRDIVLFYLVSTPEEIAYQDVLDQAVKKGVKVFPVVSAQQAPRDWPTSNKLVGPLDKKLISQQVPDFAERYFYLSGPQAMVDACKATLIHAGLSRQRIKTDHFSGY